MAEGGVAPPPPKRPTIIRQQNENSGSVPKVPSRPAPPAPGGRPPPPETVSAGRNSIKERPPPSETGRPPPKPPHSFSNKDSGDSDQNDSAVPLKIPPKIPERPTSSAPKPSSSSVKKRPEITIVAARPMSEVGFRGEECQNLSSTPVNLEANKEASPNPVRKPPGRPVSGPALPPVPPRTDLADQSISQESSRLPSPLLPDDVSSVKERSETKAPSPKPAARAPPRLPAPKVGSLGDLGANHRSPFLSRPLPHVPENNKILASKTEVPSLDDGKKVTGGKIPPPRPVARNKSPNDVGHEGINKQPPPVPSVGPKPGIVAPPGEEEDKSKQELAPISTSDTYAQIVKPAQAKSNRPTIIKPKRDTVQNKDGEEIKSPPPLPERKYEMNEDGMASIDKTNDNSNVMDTNTHIHPTEVENSASFSIKDRLKKFDAVKNDSSLDDVEKNSGAKKAVGKPPPPIAAKPKPTVLRKPKPNHESAIKQEITDKSLTSSEKQSTGNVNSRTNNSTSKLDSDISCETEEISTAKSTVTQTRKPTVIRPPAKPKRANVDDKLESQSSEDGKAGKMFLDDTEIERRSRPQPPMPNKLPVIVRDKGLDDNGDDAEINVSTVQTRPKPVARARPMSMQVLSKSEKSKLEEGVVKPFGRPPPPNVLGRPPPPKVKSAEDHVKVRPTIVRKSQNDENSSKAPKPETRNKSPLTEAPPVTERKENQQCGTPTDERGSKAPPRPSSKPSTPVAQPRITPEEKPSEDSEVMVDVKPSRPKAGPARPLSTPIKSADEKESLKKPPKPQPPRPSVPKVEKSPDLPPRPGPGHLLYHHMMSTPHGIAVYEFPGSQEDELSFNEGEVIILKRRVDESWLSGKIGEKQGIFPEDFVQVLVPLPGELQEEALMREMSVDMEDDEIDYPDMSMNVEKHDWIGSGPRCCARFDFEGEGKGDLQFEEGDYVKLIGREDAEWLRGEFDGKVGIFPLSFVEIIEDLPSDSEDFSPQNKIVTDYSPMEDTGKQTTTPGGEKSETQKSVSEHQQAQFSCMALYDYEGGPGELSLKFGDYISVHSRIDNEWLLGEKDGVTGKFPIKCIDEVPSGVPSSKEKSSQNTKPQDISPVYSSKDICIAVHDYEVSSPEDLPFREGDSIQIIERVNDDWLKGSLHGKIGIFPASFVVIKSQTPVEEPKHKSSETLCGLALYDFEGQDDSELSFKAGDIIILGDLVAGAEDWRMGEIGNNHGIFPASFVEEQTS